MPILNLRAALIQFLQWVIGGTANVSNVLLCTMSLMICVRSQQQGIYWTEHEDTLKFLPVCEACGCGSTFALSHSHIGDPVPWTRMELFGILAPPPLIKSSFTNHLFTTAAVCLAPCRSQHSIPGTRSTRSPPPPFSMALYRSRGHAVTDHGLTGEAGAALGRAGGK